MKRFPLPLVITTAIIIVAALFVRFFAWNSLPVTVQQDESVYSLNAASIALTGTNYTRDQQPFSLIPVSPAYSELTATVLAPFFTFLSPLGLSHRTIATIPFLIIGFFSPLLIALITKELTKSSKVAYFTWFIALFNPFFWQISRLGYDACVSLFFYLIGTWLMLRLPRSHKLWSVIPFFIGFYQYQGYKLLLAPWLCCLGLYFLWPSLIAFFKSAQKNIKTFFQKLDLPTLLPVAAIILIFAGLSAFYLFVQLPQQSNSYRAADIISPQQSSIVEATTQAQLHTLQTPLSSLLVNKYVTFVQEIIQRYLELYSPFLLFWRSGEVPMHYTVNYYGLFHLIDALFVLFGLIVIILQKKWRLGAFLFLALLVAPLPGLLNEGTWYFWRASFRLVPLIILAGLGLEYLFSRFNFFLKTLLMAAYFGFILYFAFLYFYRLPLTSADDHHYRDRQISEFIRRLPPGTTVNIHNSYPQNTFSNYLYYNDLVNQDTISQIQASFSSQNFQLNQPQSIQLVSGCVDLNIATAAAQTVIIANDLDNCHNQSQSLSQAIRETDLPYQTIRSLRDGAEEYYLFGLSPCAATDISGGLPAHRLTDFNFAQLSDHDFCRLFVTAR